MECIRLRWTGGKKILQIKAFFEKKTGCSIYDLLPGVVENSFRQEESHAL